ncbi:hypothetical protein [Burkholderia latens]|uniref:Uncharacterized protein n=1 Tax=Burkholderia latens TaxID=488446 RepID=A0A6P2JSR0_9BURK|nr:hypothetical protein [Burkholderia latens]VWB44346.1 hypothetical protein BLA24064_01986 [Burkholderia latens]
MNKTLLNVFGLVTAGLLVTLVIVLETAPRPQENAALAAAKTAKAR